MSLRWSLYVAPKPSKGWLKTQNGRFPCKIALRLKKVCYNVSLSESSQRQSCKAFNGLTIREKVIGRDVPFYAKIWWMLTHRLQITHFLYIFSRSTSVITPSVKSLINTNRKSTARFLISQRWTSYVAPKPLEGGSKTQCPKFEHSISCDNSERYEIGCQLLLITNRKSHTGFRLIPTSMTSNDLERCNNPYFAFFFHRIWLLFWPNTSQWLNICL